ncbi:MAG: hypothetical protein Q3972_06090 [Corynebacterium sp.]|nr:hypothetical protein [Corynebacterium sp.]
MSTDKKKQNFKDPRQVRTAPVVATGLLGSWVIATQTGIRPLGAALVGATGGYSAWCWFTKSGPQKAAALLGTFTAAAMGAHVAAEKISRFPGVVVTAALAAVAAHFINDEG